MNEVVNHCDVCNVTYPGGFSAYIRHNSGREHKAIEHINSVIRHMNYAAECLAELKIKPEIRNEIPAFDSVKRCPKCNYWFKLTIPTTRYKASKNVMERGCHCCGATWNERVADGTEPIWEKIE